MHYAIYSLLVDFSGTLKPGEVYFCASQIDDCGLMDDPKMADGVARGPMLVCPVDNLTEHIIDTT